MIPYNLIRIVCNVMIGLVHNMNMKVVVLNFNLYQNFGEVMLRQETFGMTHKFLDFRSQKWSTVSSPKNSKEYGCYQSKWTLRTSSKLVKILEVRGFGID